jgi:hypothetical protein
MMLKIQEMTTQSMRYQARSDGAGIVAEDMVLQGVPA